MKMSGISRGFNFLFAALLLLAVLVISFPVTAVADETILLAEDFEDGGLDPRISIETVGSFSSNPGIKAITNFGSTKVFGYGRSNCRQQCFNNHVTNFKITFPSPTYVSSISFKEMELYGNWGSKGKIYLDGIELDEDLQNFGRVPSNDYTADTAYRTKTFPINQFVTVVELKVADITSSSEIIIDDLLITGFVSYYPSETIFYDDFESYTEGTFPSSGGWQLIYNGSGTSSQYVDNTHSVSGSKSLHLVGSSCWSSNVYHTVDLPSRVTLEAEIFVDQIVSCGCTPLLAHLGLNNPNLGTWGTGYGLISFNCDGKVYARQKSTDRNQDVLLMSYNAQTWYHAKLDVDLTARQYDVYIDGVLLGSGLEILDDGMPTGVQLSAGHGGYPTVWFDDVKVTNLQETQQYTLTLEYTGNGSGTVTSDLSGINCANSCSSNFNSGAQVTLAATADSGSTLTNWSGCDSTNGNQCTVAMNNARSVTVTFSLNQTQNYTLTITKSGTGNGRVTSSPSGIDCGSACSSVYNQGAVVTLMAVPDNGCIFAGWNGGNCGSAGTCITTVNGDTNITAIFSLQTGTPKITVSPKSANFGSVGIDSISGPKTITINNKGKGYLAINSISITGVNADEFDETNNCSSISPGGLCTITTSFAPTSFIGKRSAAIAISSNDPKKPTILVKLSGQAAPRSSIEGTWDIRGKMKIKVRIEGEGSQTQRTAFTDEFNFYNDGYFEMIDMYGTWSHNGINFIVTLDPESVSDYFAGSISDEIGSDVSVAGTQMSFTGKKQINGTIKGKMKLDLTFYIKDYDLSGNVTVSSSFTGRQISTQSMSSMKEKKASPLPGTILNVIEQKLHNAVRSSERLP